MQPLVTLEVRSSLTQLITLRSTITSSFVSLPTNFMVNFTMSQAESAGILVLHPMTNLFLQSTSLPPFQLMSTFDFSAPIYTPIQSLDGLLYQPLLPLSSAFNLILQPMLSGGPLPPIPINASLYTFDGTPIELAITKRLAEMEAIIQ